MPKFFGTDGIRAKAGQFPLEPNALFIIGRALGRLLKDRLNRPARAVLGRDTRESGGWIESALAAGFAEAGGEATSAGVITTPGVAYLTRKFHFDVGIVISASHNPFQDNGIKIFSPSGKKFDEQDEELIEAELLSANATNNDLATPALTVDTNLVADYANFLQHEIGQGINLSGYKLAVDCAHGAASHIAPKLFQNMGAEIVCYGNEPDGQNINKDCGSLHIDHLKKLVVSEHCHLGIAFDGDADRVLFVNEKGEFVDGDHILFIMADYFQRQNRLQPTQVVATVMSNIGLELALQKRGIHLKRTAVGDKYVLEELLASQSLVGGEQSGHIIFPQISLAGDGIITALQVLRVLTEHKVSLSTASSDFQSYPQILINIKVKSKPAFESVPAIAVAAAAVEQELTGQGRLLLRYSGTENLARVMIEGPDQHSITQQAEQLANVIREHLG